MKKVSVQFNLVVGERLTHKLLRRWVKEMEMMRFWKITSIQINDIEKRGKR